MPLIIGEDFNGYANNTALSAQWTHGLLANGVQHIGSVVIGDASPDGSQYIQLGADIEGAVGMPWGTQSDIGAHTFTGLTPTTQYQVKWQMQLGYSTSSGISGFPAAHTFTAGLAANAARYLIGINDHIEPQGIREDPGFPGDVVQFWFNDVDFVGEPTVCRAVGICGWNDYSLVTTSDASGNILVSIGTFDERFFPAYVYFDNIEIWSIEGPPRPASRLRPQVFGIGRK